jgi:hypothetical protein
MHLSPFVPLFLISQNSIDRMALFITVNDWKLRKCPPG